MADDLQIAEARRIRVMAALGALDAAARRPFEPPADDPVFVCAIGWRCGSTLLQRILMTDPRILVWGEPLDRLGVLSRLSDIVAGVSPDWPPSDHWYTHTPNVDRVGSFVANLSPDASDLRASLRGMLDGWLAASARREGFSRWGVKEVRWSGEQALILRWLYPAARFVVIARHPVWAYNSMRLLGLSADGPGFWARWPDRLIHSLDDYAAYWNELALSWSLAADALGAAIIRYEDLIGDRIDWRRLGERLDLVLDPARALAIKAGPTPAAGPIPASQAARVNALTAAGRLAFSYGD